MRAFCHFVWEGGSIVCLGAFWLALTFFLFCLGTLHFALTFLIFAWGLFTLKTARIRFVRGAKVEACMGRSIASNLRSFVSSGYDLKAIILRASEVLLCYAETIQQKL
jgi:hypothetical protein